MSFELPTTYEVETCIHEKCGVHFAVPSLFQKERKKDHKMFYCPNGHGQYYTAKSEIERLKEELAKKDQVISSKDEKINNLNERRKYLKNSRAAYKAHLTRYKNKGIQNGKNN